MAHIKELDRYQKALLVLLVLMAGAFLVIYGTVSSRVGYLYKDRIFVPEQNGDSTVYTGKLDGVEAAFTVTADNAITFHWGEKAYGPYTVKKDPTAVPKDEELKDRMTGIEVRDKDKIIFRGGVLDLDHTYMLYREDGRTIFNITVQTGSGTVIDSDGNVVDPHEPSIHTILELLEGPKLEKKGQWGIWFLAVFFSGITAISILFADELFHLRLSFRVADPYGLEPSDWEIFGRYTSWTVMTIMILVFYILGLQ